MATTPVVGMCWCCIGTDPAEMTGDEVEGSGRVGSDTALTS